VARWFWDEPATCRGSLRSPGRSPPTASGCSNARRARDALGDLNLIDIILSAVVPVFFVMALGYLAGWLRDIDNLQVAAFNALVMDFALPASLFVAMVQTLRELLLKQGALGRHPVDSRDTLRRRAT
jgi:hypothetical protein